MSYTAGIFNAVTQALKDAAQGTANPVLPMEAQLIYEAATPTAGMQLPYLLVRLPQEPYSSGVWAGSSNLRNSLFIVDVDAVTEIVPERTQPYGNDALPGILTLADDVMDVLENARAAILLSCPKVVDYEITATAHSRAEGDGRQVVATIRIAFKVRFFAGAR